MGRPVPSAGPHHGRVASFNRARGLGTVASDAGDVFDFHATAIADGTRTIEVGTDVAFVVTPGHRGRYEAVSLIPLIPLIPSAGPSTGA